MQASFDRQARHFPFGIAGLEAPGTEAAPRAIISALGTRSGRPQAMKGRDMTGQAVAAESEPRNILAFPLEEASRFAIATTCCSLNA